MKTHLITILVSSILCLSTSSVFAGPQYQHIDPDIFQQIQPVVPQVDPDDVDGDGILNVSDNCKTIRNGNCNLTVNKSNCDVNKNGVVTDAEEAAGYQADLDQDGIGDACEDSDGDSVLDYLDNCPENANATQDAAACQDFDGDKIADSKDNCGDDINPDQSDVDGDGVGDACDICRFVANPGQEDADKDGFGDACADDYDGDSVGDSVDNCIRVFNPAQEDSDNDGIGDACEVQAANPTTPTTTTPQLEQQMSYGSCTLVIGTPLSGSVSWSLVTLLIGLPALLKSRNLLRKETK